MVVGGGGGWESFMQGCCSSLAGLLASLLQTGPSGFFPQNEAPIVQLNGVMLMTMYGQNSSIHGILFS